MSAVEARQLRERLRCYLVTDPRVESVERMIEITRAAIDGGMTAVQLRAKGWTDRRTFEAARQLAELCRARDVMFLVNDRVDIALACGADGVHVGVADLPVGMARELLGPDAVIGYSPETDVDRREAIFAGADYLGTGPVFGTTTKDDAGIALGLPAFKQIVDSVQIPVIGIGGIDQVNARSVIDAGAAGVAVVSAVFFAERPGAAARELAGAVR